MMVDTPGNTIDAAATKRVIRDHFIHNRSVSRRNHGIDELQKESSVPLTIGVHVTWGGSDFQVFLW